MADDESDAAVIGGAVSGLAAAQELTETERIDSVTVFERQSYDEKRVNCGEAINDAPLIPLEKTPENGFLNDVDGFQLRVYDGTNRNPSADPLGVSNLVCEPGYICARNTVERRWAEHLESLGVEFETGTSVSPAWYEEIIDRYDYMIDATGQPSLSLKTRGLTSEYTGDMVALNATVEGDFSEYVDCPRIYFEGYVGYAWSFPKSETHANVGIGWAGEKRPEDYMEAFAAAAERNGFPMPDREDVHVYTIPKGPSLDPRRVTFPEDGVFLVGDAAGIANRYQGEGICQGIRSSYLLCDLIETGREDQYPERLYDLMKSEFRLAHLMRGAWVEHEDARLLAAIAESIDGLAIEEVTRSPGTVMNRLARDPKTASKLFLNSGMLRRVYEAYTDSWEYTGKKTA